MGPLLMAGLGLGMSALNKLINGSNAKPFDITPYEKDITYSNGDLNSMRSSMGQQIQSGLMPELQSVRAAGATGRIPFSAVMAGLRGISRTAGEAISRVEPALQDRKRSAKMAYLQLLRQTTNDKENIRAASMNFSPEIGMFTKALMLAGGGGGNQGAGFLGGSPSNPGNDDSLLDPMNADPRYQ